jgi:hypothetical protein
MNSENKSNIISYLKGCLNPENGRLYGNFQQRAALNITQFPKIQFSIIIRMGFIYPIISSLITQMGLSADKKIILLGVIINYHTWVAGYLAYLIEIQLGLSKYPIEFIQKNINSIRRKYK